MSLPPPLTLDRAWLDASRARTRRRRGSAWLVLALGVAIGGALVVQLLDERWLWRSGAPAASADVRVDDVSLGSLHHVELDVRYRAGEGLRGGPDGTVSYFGLGRGSDEARPVEVRWRGTRFVTSWQIAATRARLWALAGLEAFVALVAACFFAWARRGHRYELALERIARHGEELELPIVRVRELLADLPPTLRMFRLLLYRVAIPVEAAATPSGYREPARQQRWQERTFAFRHDGHPLKVIDAAPQRLVALRDPADARRLVFVREDRWPFAPVP